MNAFAVSFLHLIVCSAQCYHTFFWFWFFNKPIFSQCFAFFNCLFYFVWFQVFFRFVFSWNSFHIFFCCFSILLKNYTSPTFSFCSESLIHLKSFSDSIVLSLKKFSSLIILIFIYFINFFWDFWDNDMKIIELVKSWLAIAYL